MCVRAQPPRLEPGLTDWKGLVILPRPGCPRLGRILGIELHPHESRKTS